MNEVEFRHLIKETLGDSTPRQGVMDWIERSVGEPASRRSAILRARRRVVILFAIAALTVPTVALAAPALIPGGGGLAQPKAPRGISVSDATLKLCSKLLRTYRKSFTTTATDVEKGMLCGSAIFDGTAPVCSVVMENVEYACVLSHAPTKEVISPWRGVRTELDVNGQVVGGCMSTAPSGLQWRCYVGQAAVDHGVLDESRLGSRQFLGPAFG